MNMFTRTGTSIMSLSWSDVSGWSYSCLGNPLKDVWRTGSCLKVGRGLECHSFTSVWVEKSSSALLRERACRREGHVITILYDRTPTRHDITHTGQQIILWSVN
jgi:hypothetical protein